MRRFLILVHRVPTGGQFTLNDLAGGGGRIDEIARSVSTGFLLSNDLRRDTEMTLLFAYDKPPGARRIRLFGERLRHLNPDERSTAALLKNALVRAIPSEHDIESSPGLVVGPVDPIAEITQFAGLPGPLWLTEEGRPFDEGTGSPAGFAAVLGDPYGPSPEETDLLERLGLPKVSLGPRSIRVSQCIDVLHNLYDRREAPAPPIPP
ncbi:MAG: tRNA (pseudouridine(54)-N(1))-methyltransferase TrmY [Thermoplasmata archaeon]|nr:tRNA (pseudouridine(54)-N(1))-methyltransferase TrmY [Thermoplasmata archaeon]